MRWLRPLGILAVSAALGCLGEVRVLRALPPIPVIIDTDVGDDFDDSWALALALKSPRLDPKLITTTFGNSEYRAKIIARYLIAAGRQEIPIALGAKPDRGTGQQLRAWLGNFQLSDSGAKIEQNAAQILVDTVHRSSAPVTIIELGPMETLAAALKLDPGIAAQANLVAMLGSIRIGYGHKAVPAAEYNVAKDIASAQAVLSAPWQSVTITPLDTAGSLHLDEPRFAKIAASPDPLLATLLSSYRGFIQSFVAENGREKLRKYGYPPPENVNFGNPDYDVVGVYLADAADRDDLRFENLRILVTNDGYTKIDPRGHPMQVATSWIHPEHFLDRTVQMLVSPKP